MASPVPAVGRADQQKEQDRQLAAKDALSYIDKDYDDPRMKQTVHSLIEEEMAAFDPPDYLADKPPPKMRFQSPLLKAEWARVRAGIQMDPIDTSRYDLQPPQGAAAEDEMAWKRALGNVRAQTEHQHNRCANSAVGNAISLIRAPHTRHMGYYNCTTAVVV